MFVRIKASFLSGLLIISTFLVILVVVLHREEKSLPVKKMEHPEAKRVTANLTRNSVEESLRRAKMIRSKVVVDKQDLLRKDEILKALKERTAIEMRSFEKSAKDVEQGQVDLENQKTVLRNSIVEGKSKEFLSSENKKFEILADNLISKQRELNERYLQLMRVQDQVVQELVSNK